MKLNSIGSTYGIMQSSLQNFAFQFAELDLTVEQVEEAMGYPRGESPEPFPEMINLALSQSVDLTDIKGSLFVSEHFSLDRSGVIIMEGIAFSIGEKIARQLRKAEGGAFFICTAGAGIGDKSKELMAEGYFMEGYILDVIGSLTVEAVIDKMQNMLELELSASGRRVANRYSPGYCGWPLNEQKHLFKVFPDNYCGIKLSESCLMEPAKSLSGVIGFGVNVHRTAYECDICELKTCLYRKIRLSKVK